MSSNGKREDIVISGISGRFPASDDIEKFKNNLFTGVDMVTADEVRWPLGFFRLPHRNGKVYSMDKFDSQFFGIPQEDVEFIDPQERLLMEEVYTSILDAGIDPESLRGTNTGYFHGACYVETNEKFDNPETVPEGKYKALITRVSRFLGLRGPILEVDTACGSGLSSFSEAYHSVKNGICDQAIATASNTVFRPRISAQFRDLKMITKDGKCKGLDASADGYVRSEAVVSTFLQKSKDAKRIYCFLLGCRSNSDGYKEEGITFPSIKGQIQLLKETYEDAGIQAGDIDYIEAHITGTKAGDPVETNAMYEVICSKKDKPLLVGCLKSNIGHTEGSSGLCAIAKACIIYQTGLIPPNIHFVTPNLELKGLDDGKMKPVVQVTSFTGKYIPVNCFGFGGANTHLLTSNTPHNPHVLRRECDFDITTTDVPSRLIPLCGRTIKAVNHLFSTLKSKPVYLSRDFLSIVAEFSKQKHGINQFKYRGYAIATKIEGGYTFKMSQVTDSYATNNGKRGAILNFPSASEAMALTFDKISKFPFFENSVKTFQQVIQQQPSADFKDIIMAKSVAMQIGVVDMLNGLSLNIEQVQGHSTGELACSYYHQKITAFEAINCALQIRSGKASNCNWFSHNNQVGMKVDGARDKNMIHVEVDSSLLGLKHIIRKSADLFYTTLETLGDMYVCGLTMDIEKLYPSVSYPLATSTPFFSPLLRWDYSLEAPIKPYMYNQNMAFSFQKAKNIVYRFNQNKSDESFLYDHKIDGRILFPAIGYLMIAWSSLEKLNKTLMTEVPVKFEKIKFLRATVMQSESECMLSVRINEDSGAFEIKEGDVNVVTGFIKSLDSSETCSYKGNKKANDLMLDSRDIYKELRVRGYDYGPFFQGLTEASTDGTNGKIIWREVVNKSVKDSLNLETGEDFSDLWAKSWCTFVDSMLQLQLIKCESDSRYLFVPTSIESLTVIPEEIKSFFNANPMIDSMTNTTASLIPVSHDPESGLLSTHGISIKGFKGSLLSRKKQQVKLLKYQMTPLDNEMAIDSIATKNLLDSYHKKLINLDESTINLDDERFALMKKLKSTQEEEISLKKDLLVGFLKNSPVMTELSFLKTAVDIAVYNNISNNTISSFDVLEIDSSPEGKDVLCESMKEILNEHMLSNQFNVNYTLMHQNPSTLSEEAKEGLKEKEIIPLDPIYAAAPTLDENGNPLDQVKGNIPSSNLVLFKYTQSMTQLPMEGQHLLENLFNITKEGGFLALLFKYPFHDSIKSSMEQIGLQDDGIKDPDYLFKLAESVGFKHISSRFLTNSLPYGLFLFRKLQQKSLPNVIIPVGTSNYSQWLDQLKEKMSQKNCKIWLIPDVREKKAFHSKITGLVGLVKSLRLENGGENIRCILDFTESHTTDLNKLQSMMEKDLFLNVKLSNTQGWGSYEHMMLPSDTEEQPESFENTEHVYLRSLKPGDLTSLTWVKNQIPTNPQMQDNYVTVSYSALNFKDILFATGRLPLDAIPANVSARSAQDSLLGLEYAGISNSGQRMMGILPFKALASTIPISAWDLKFMWPVPDSWTLEEASTIPVVYSTVLYALLIRGKMMNGESILIHAGAGGVGLAAINVCLHFGCNIFTTVGSVEKKNFLIQHFGGRLNEHQILNSRSNKFEEEILDMTIGQGVDIILNSLSDEMFESTIRCLSENGRFMEIGKVDMLNDRTITLNNSMSHNQSFHGVFLDTLLIYTDHDYFSRLVESEKQLLYEGMISGIRDGYIKPLPRTVFPMNKVEDAFRYMAGGKHIGKVVIQMKPQETTRSLKSTFMNPMKSYLVLGGLGGLGLELVQWLVLKGARCVIINSRRGISNNYQQMVVNRLKAEGINVIISQADSTNADGVRQLIELGNTSSSMGLGGIFNSAVVYQDVLFCDQTVDIFEQVAAPKSEATLLLDSVSRELCPNLDYFVTFSSISSGRGNEGQTNYNFGNSMMDSICLSRVQDGLPGLSVQWGVIGDVGLVADLHSISPDGTSSGTGGEVVLLGSASQRVHSVFETLDRIINYETMGCISSIVRPSASSGGSKEGAADLLKLISNIVGLKDISSLDPSTSLGSLGIDSLIAVEIKQVIERVVGVNIGIKEVREMTIAGIQDIAESALTAKSAAAPPPASS